MRKPTVRYIFIATAAMAVCLVIYQVAPPPETVIDLNDSDPAPPPFRWHYVLSWWPIQAVNFILGIGTLMHVLTSLVGLIGWRQWITAILVPTLGLTAWYSFAVRILGHHPGSIDEWGCIQGGLLGSTVGFGIVSFVVVLPDLLALGNVHASQESTEQ